MSATDKESQRGPEVSSKDGIWQGQIMPPPNKKRAPLAGASSGERPFLQEGSDDKGPDTRYNDESCVRDPDLVLITTCKKRASHSELDPDISADLPEHDPDLPKKEQNKNTTSPPLKRLRKKQLPASCILNRVTILQLPMPLHST